MKTSFSKKGNTWRGRKVTLNSPRKIKGVTPYPKKKTVFVKNSKGNVVAVHFGDVRYSDFTKHKNEIRRSNFRSRHNCETAKDKTTARYWACKNLW
jgi:hypothetical protein